MMEYNQRSESSHRPSHYQTQLAYRPSTVRKPLEIASFPLTYNNSLSLCLSLRAVQRSHETKDASLWRDGVNGRQLIFSHTCTIKINVGSNFSETRKPAEQQVWTDSHETSVFGVGKPGGFPDSLLLRDAFIVPATDPLSSKSLLGHFSGQDESSFMISVSLSFDYETAAKDISCIVNPMHPEDGTRHVVLSTHNVIVPFISSQIIMLPMYLLSPKRTEFSNCSIIMEWDWRKQNFSNCISTTLDQRYLQLKNDLKPKVRVRYRFISGDRFQQFDLNDLSCPLCELQDFGTLDDLFLHFRTNHDFLKFSLDRREVREDSVRAKFSIVIRQNSELVSTHRETEYEKRQQQQVLNQPTNCETKEISIYRKNPPGVSEHVYPPSMQRLHDRYAEVGFTKAQALNEGEYTEDQCLSKMGGASEDFSDGTCWRKMNQVPKAPEGVIFFHTITKRPLVEGELVSESDDEVDKSWLKAKHMQNLADLEGLEHPTIQLLQKYDQHLWEERLHGNRFTSDTLKRFAHDNRDFLNGGCIRNEFLYKASNMISSGACDLPTVEKLIQIVSPEDTEQVYTMKSRHAGGKNSGNPNAFREGLSSNPMERNDGSSLTPLVSQEQDLKSLRPYKARHGGAITSWDYRNIEKFKWRPNTCICGSHAIDVGNVIVCSNAKCRSKIFHRTCVGVREIRTNWLCPTCSAVDSPNK